MKTIIVILSLLIFYTPSIYSQDYGDYYDGKDVYYYDDNNNLVKKPKNKSQKKQSKKTVSSNYNAFTMQPENFPQYIAIYPHVYIPTGKTTKIKEYTTYGGGFGLKHKYNFNRWSGVITDFTYTYGEGTKGIRDGREKLEYHEMDIRSMAVLQYEQSRDETGINFWIGGGFTLSFGLNYVTRNGIVYGSNIEGSYPLYKYKDIVKTFDANVGLMAGTGFRYIFYNDFSVGFAVDYTYVFPIYDNSGVRIMVEAGYRF